MTTAKQAAEDLKAIRSLMEKATVYRAISAPSALAAGLMCWVATLLVYFVPISSRPPVFLACWGLLLVLSSLANAWFLWRASKLRGEEFVSPGMRVALRSLLPPMLAGGIFSLWLLFKTGDTTTTVNLWILFYGLALLTTQEFAPRSIPLLGWAFTLTGLAVFIWGGEVLKHVWQPSTILMALTFGSYHIVYAILAWPRNQTTKDH